MDLNWRSVGYANLSDKSPIFSLPVSRFCFLLLRSRIVREASLRILMAQPETPDFESEKENAPKFHWRAFQVGQFIDVLDSSEKWSEGEVVGIQGSTIEVHYLYWAPKWNELLPKTSNRLSPYGSRACNTVCFPLT
jgi:hypothetical protein